MLGIVFKILSILGIVLLAVLGLALLALAALLFFPFTYRVHGSKDAQGLCLTAKVNWLFGLFRVRLLYPQPGRLTAKVLWFSLLDMQIPPEKEDRAEEASEEGHSMEEEHSTKAEATGDAHSAGRTPSGGDAQTESSAGAMPDAADAEPPGREGPDPVQAEKEAQEAASGSATEPTGKISQKFQRIKYTIYHIYDKIEDIWKNISYYMELLREENTRQAAVHAFLRASKVLKSFRPRHVRAELLFGTGAPDTTGYLYGAYCALSASLGTGFWVTPDFEQKRLEGEFEIAGHVILWVFVINALRLLLDKKLRLFLKKWKKGVPQKKGQKKLEKAPAQ